MEGYVYRWTDSSNGMKYIGSHNGANKHYIGSGKLFKEAYKKRPECFTREILYTGPDYIELEEFILETVDAKNDDTYYNEVNKYLGGFVGSGKDNPFYGKKHTEESKKKMREIRDNRSEETKEEINKKISESMNRFKKPVKELSTGLRFESLGECSKHFKLNKSHITRHILNDRPVSRGPNKGKHFIYEKQNN